MSFVKFCLLCVHTEPVSLESEIMLQKENSMFSKPDNPGIDVLFFEPQRIINVEFDGKDDSLRLNWHQWHDAILGIDMHLRDEIMCTYVGDPNQMPEEFVKYLIRLRHLTVSVQATRKKRIFLLNILKQKKIRFITCSC